MPRLPPFRLPTRHVYRAFRELDTYSDEQCRRFLRAARGSWVRRGFGRGCIGGVWLGSTIGGIAAFLWFQDVFLARHRTLDVGHPLVAWYGILLNIAAVMLVLGISALCAFYLRDYFVIRRVRRILRTRGVCMMCRYTLVGLFVGEDLLVKCPECGTETRVDPALGELVVDSEGRARFKPDETRHKARYFWTEKRIKRLKRAAPYIAAVVVGLPLVLGVGYEGFIRWQAGVARRDRPGPWTLSDLVAQQQGGTDFSGGGAAGGSGNDSARADGWALFQDASQVLADLDREVWGTGAAWTTEHVYPEYTYVYAPPFDSDGSEGDEEDPSRREFDVRCRDLALEMLGRLEETAIFDVLEKCADAASDDRPFEWSATTPMDRLNASDLGEARTIAQIVRARMFRSREAGDRERYIASMRAGLGMSAVLLRQPLVMEWMLGSAIEAIVLEQVRHDLLDGASNDWLADVDAALAWHDARTTRTNWIEGNRVSELDTVGWHFGDASRVRLGRWSPSLRGYIRDGLRLGTYSENVAAVEDRTQLFRDWQSQVVCDRPWEFPGAAELILLRWPIGGLAIVEGQARLALGGTRCMVALERYRAAHGEYPVSLDALAPGYLASVPLDPWVGTPMGYIRVDPSEDRFGRGYLIYSTGSDAADNGGRENPNTTNRYLTLKMPPQPVGSGYDFVVNQRD